MRVKIQNEWGKFMDFKSNKISLIAIFATFLSCVDIDNEGENTQQLGQDQSDFERFV